MIWRDNRIQNTKKEMSIELIDLVWFVSIGRTLLIDSVVQWLI